MASDAIRADAARDRPARRRRRLVDAATGWALVSPAALVVIGLSLVPMGWALLLSFRAQDLITPGHGVGTANYHALVDDPAFRGAVRNTISYSAVFVPLSCIVGLGIAILLNQRVRLVGFYRTCVFAPFVASAAAEGILFGWVFDPNFGAMNGLLHVIGISRQGFLENPDQALWVLTAVSLWGGIGFNVVIYLAALQDVPVELREAALIVGATPWQTFRRIVLPLLVPVTFFLVLYQTITALQLFDLVYATTKGGPLDSTTTVVYFVYQQAFQFFHAGYGAAAAWILAVGILVVGAGQAILVRIRGAVR